MSLTELEEEIKEIEEIRKHFKPGSLEWNNIDAIVTEKKRKLSRLKTDEYNEEDDILIGCEGDCRMCGGVR